MSDLTKWPSARTGIRKPQQSVAIPREWFRQFREALLWLRENGYAENESHAIIRAVIETAERMRKERE